MFGKTVSGTTLLLLLTGFSTLAFIARPAESSWKSSVEDEYLLPSANLNVDDAEPVGLNVTVKWRDGSPFSGAYVEIGNETWYSSHYTDASGSCSWEGLNKGNYTIWTDPATNETKVTAAWGITEKGYFTLLTLNRSYTDIQLFLADNLKVLENYRSYPRFLRLCIDMFAKAGFLYRDPRYYLPIAEGKYRISDPRAYSRNIYHEITTSSLGQWGANENFWAELPWMNVLFDIYMRHEYLHEVPSEALAWWAQRRTGEIWPGYSFNVAFFREAILWLAENITSGCLTETESAERIVKWVVENIAYEGGTEDILEEILKLRKGLCDERATLMVALTKAAGIPSREITGFAVGGWNHAWMECYLNDTWIAYDTTGALHSPCWEPVHVSDLSSYDNLRPIMSAKSWLASNATLYTVDQTFAYSINGTENLVRSLKTSNLKPEAQQALNLSLQYIREWKKVAYDTNARNNLAELALSEATRAWYIQKGSYLGSQGFTMINLWEYANLYYDLCNFRPTYANGADLNDKKVALYGTVVNYTAWLTYYDNPRDEGEFFPWPKEDGCVTNGEQGFGQGQLNFPLFRFVEGIRHIIEVYNNVEITASLLCYDANVVYKTAVAEFYPVILNMTEVLELNEKFSQLSMVEAFAYRDGRSAVEKALNLYLNFYDSVRLANQSSDKILLRIPRDVDGYGFFIDAIGTKSSGEATWKLVFTLGLLVDICGVQVHLRIDSQGWTRYELDSIRMMKNGNVVLAPPYIDCPAGRYVQSDSVICLWKEGSFLNLELNYTGALTELALDCTELPPPVLHCGENCSFLASVRNIGNTSIIETLFVDLLCNNCVVTSRPITSLGAGEERSLTLDWKITGLVPGNYTLKARVNLLQGEIDEGNNVALIGVLTLLPAIPSIICLPEVPWIGERVNLVAPTGYDNYTWTFGDGNTTETATSVITHTYHSIGKYAIVLAVTYKGLEETTTLSLTVTFRTNLNRDGKVDILDIAIVSKAYGSRPGDPNWNELADLDNNNLVNIIDIAMVAKDYGKTV
jgi:hypothetical protein